MKVGDIVNELERLKGIVESSVVARDYITKYIATDSVLTHGETSGNVDGFKVVTNLVDRLPTNTPLYIHEYIDTLFEYRLGHPYRSSSLFTYKQDIERPVNGRYIVLPIGNNATMMVIKGVSDFYHRIVDAYTQVSQDVTALIRNGYDISDDVADKLTQSIYLFLEQDMYGEDDRSVFVVHIMNQISSELRKYLETKEFEDVVRKHVLDKCDIIVRDAFVFDDSAKLKRVSNEEVHLQSDEYVFIGVEWLTGVAKESNKTIKNLLRELL